MSAAAGTGLGTSKSGAAPAPAPALPQAPDTAIQVAPVAQPTTLTASPAAPAYKPPRRSRGILCCRRPHYDHIATVINRMESLTPSQKDIVHERYVQMLRSYATRAHAYAMAFHGLRLIVTVGSLLVPALLSVQQLENHKDSIYWFTWALSLAVTMSNGVLTLFKVEKKYYYLYTAYELMHSEGWQFISLTGKYGVHGTLRKEGAPAFTHQTAFEHFCHYVEKLKLRQVDDEYYKVINTANDQATTADGAATVAGKSMMNLQTPAEKTVADLAARIVRTAPKDTLDQLKEFTELLAKPTAAAADTGKSK